MISFPQCDEPATAVRVVHSTSCIIQNCCAAFLVASCRCKKRLILLLYDAFRPAVCASVDDIPAFNCPPPRLLELKELIKGNIYSGWRFLCFFLFYLIITQPIFDEGQKAFIKKIMCDSCFLKIWCNVFKIWAWGLNSPLCHIGFLGGTAWALGFGHGSLEGSSVLLHRGAVFILIFPSHLPSESTSGLNGGRGQYNRSISLKFPAWDSTLWNSIKPGPKTTVCGYPSQTNPVNPPRARTEAEVSGSG